MVVLVLVLVLVVVVVEVVVEVWGDVGGRMDDDSDVCAGEDGVLEVGGGEGDNFLVVPVVPVVLVGAGEDEDGSLVWRGTYLMIPLRTIIVVEGSIINSGFIRRRTL